jgi:hypothetical protein
MSDTLADIVDAGDALTNPRQHAEPRYEWDHNRHRKPLDPHRTVVPGLVQQLRELAEEGASNGDDTGVRSVPGSSPPGAFDAVSLLAAITFGAAWRVERIGLKSRDTAEGNIRALVGEAGRLDSDTQREIRAELRSWQRQSEILTGWRTPPRELLAPCPQCNARGALLAYADEDNPRARCTACDASWAEIPHAGEGSIRVLAAHVIAYQKRAGLTMAAARAAAVTDRRRREGRAA